MRWIVAGACVLLVGAVLLAAWLRPAHTGDTDGDGRYQWASWSVPDAGGAPKIVSVFTGDDVGDYEDVEVRVEVPGEGGIGMFASTSPDHFEIALERVWGEEPMFMWDLSTYAPGTTFTIVTRYVDAAGAVLDTETITTTRPGPPAPSDRR